MAISTKQLTCALLSAAAGVILAVALATFYAYDSSWFFVSSRAAPLHNMFGTFGAQLAAISFFLCGSAAFGVVLLLFFISYVALQSHSWRREWDRVVAGFMMVTAVAALEYYYGCSCMLGVSPGGLLGATFYHGLLSLFDVVLAFVFLHTLLFAGIILVTRISCFTVARYGASALYAVVSNRTLHYYLRTIAWYFAIPFMIATRFIIRLLRGALFDAEDHTVVDVEFDEVVQEVFADTHDHAFWQQKQGFDMPAAPQDDMQAATSLDQPQRKPAADTVTSTHKNKYVLPQASLLGHVAVKYDERKEHDEQQQRARLLEEKLERFGVSGKVLSIKTGPMITLFEYQPDADAKVSKIIALEDDLALALEAVSIRIIAPIPGRSVVGFEVAHKKHRTVFLASMLSSKSFTTFEGYLPLVLGHNVVGEDVIVDLTAMPHLLVAGSTGSGKSVALNTMLVSLLYRCTPEHVRLILIDPKRLEFSAYADIAHLMFPIVTDPKQAAPVLRFVVQTMEERYATMASAGVRNMFEYQKLCTQNPALTPMPFIVVMIDELSDLMMTAGKDVETLIARIAQMARAAGIHMIVATQRPSVDVITGLIKVNFPSRISFRVTSKIDSRTILDCNGADKLLGKGDMLFLNASSSLMRVHGAYISHHEIVQLATYVRAQRPTQYLDVYQAISATAGQLLDGDDALYTDIVAFVKTVNEISISLLQRKFRIGYNRSARIIDMLESEGIILPSDGGKMRKVIR